MESGVEEGGMNEILIFFSFYVLQPKHDVQSLSALCDLLQANNGIKETDLTSYERAREEIDVCVYFYSSLIFDGFNI